MKILKKITGIVFTVALLSVGVVGTTGANDASALSGCVSQNLSRGKTGSCVSNLQAMLNGFADAVNIQHGYSYNYSPGCTPKSPSSVPKISVDGSFGPITKGRVLTYQSATCLSADGVVGPKTWSNLCYTLASARTASNVTSTIVSAYTAAKNSGCSQLQPWGY